VGISCTPRKKGRGSHYKRTTHLTEKREGKRGGFSASSNGGKRTEGGLWAVFTAGRKKKKGEKKLRKGDSLGKKMGKAVCGGEKRKGNQVGLERRTS